MSGIRRESLLDREWYQERRVIKSGIGREELGKLLRRELLKVVSGEKSSGNC